MGVATMYDMDQEEIHEIDSVDNDEVQAVSIDGSHYKREIRRSAVDYMQSFFHDKSLFNGTPIPSTLLYSEDNISLVVNARMASDQGIDLFYKVFAEEFDLGGLSNEDEATISMDISFLMSLHRECAHRRIPKQYASGISILYLRYCACLPRKMKASA